MARRPIPMIEVDEIFFRWQQCQSLSEIARAVGQSRQTVRKYLKSGIEAGLSHGGDEAQRARALTAVREGSRSISTIGDARVQKRLEPYSEQIRAWFTEPDMTTKQVWRLLREQKKVSVSYSSLKRFVRREIRPPKRRVTVRLETPPGRQAQVDFGQVHVSIGGQKRRLWAFILTLSYSRLRFVRFVKHQDVGTWIDCHVRAFEFFHGVPETVLLDNLKAGVVRPDIYDPTINRAYAELERHYAFVVDPARVGTPEHKGKVERSVPIVRQQLVAGREYRDVADLNEKALLWCRDGIGREPHGTTQEPPLERFERDERPALKPLPPTAFDPPTWAECTVHPDHHIVFERSYYSLPTRFVGKIVWARATRKLVEILCDDVLVKTHPRAYRRGTWVTDESDYPEAAKAFLFAHPIYCREKAKELGPHLAQMMEEILSDHAIRNLRKGQALLRLADKYGAPRVDEACRYLLHFQSTEIKRLKHVLEKGIPTLFHPPEPRRPVLSQLALDFLHPPESFAACGGEK